MRRRPVSDDAGSLDLLLDTITNTLGGLLFLAILLVLLVKASKAIVREGRNAPTQDPQSIEAEIAQAEAALEGVQSELAMMQRLVGSIAGSEARQDPEGLAAMRAELDALSDRIEQAAEESQRHGAEAERLAADRERLASRAAQEADRLASLRREIDAELQSRKKDLPLPRERSARREYFSVVLRYGRLYFDRASSPQGSTATNFDDFYDLGVSRSLGGQKHRVITPKPHRGEPVVVAERLSGTVKSAIRRWPPGRYYPTVSVWDDSFAEMQALREFLVAEGYDYRLIPLTDGDEVVETYVSDPKVQ